MTLTMLLIALLPPAVSSLWWWLERSDYPFPVWVSIAAAGTLTFPIAEFWRDTLASGISLVVALLLWWRRGKGDFRRVIRLLGAKSRALLAALIRKLEEVLQPIPEGIPA